ncbi:MFS transporter [Candidatus Woesebacteria bacterium]|nr:MFS transporter [Candidatus Woesebacteria bacterium]MCD8507776.1 MFS transporter [Candidatus Woesebacteria bacterium]MCD8526963.1 MFS transporter [Candidatus Woesebacteria bacterium]MCD8545866.1 MFS transporter [Candidatus Woesebacteria bacterium]
MTQSNYTSLYRRYLAFQFLRGLHFFSAVLMPMFTDWAGLSEASVLMIQSWFWFWAFFLEIPTGTVADRWGRKYSLMLGASAWVIGALIYGSVPMLAVFLLAEFLFALGVALMSGADEALLYDALKQVGQEDQARHIMGRARAFHLAGILFSAPIGSVVAAQFGLNAPMLLSAVPALLAVVLIWPLAEPRLHDHDEMDYWQTLREGTLYFWRKKLLWPIVINATVVAVATYYVIWLYQPLFQRLEVPITWFGWAHAFFVVIEMLVSSQFVRLTHWFGGPRRFKVAVLILTALGFLSVAVYPHWVTVLVMLALSGGFGLTYFEYVKADLHRFIPSSQRGTAISTLKMLQGIGRSLLNPVVGVMIVSQMRPLMSALAFMVVASIFLLFRAPAKKVKIAE